MIKEWLLLLLRQRSNTNPGIRCFADTHCCWDPMQYPVFFPHGACGWNIDMPKNQE